MKKIILAVTMLAFASAITFLACKKEATTTLSTSTKAATVFKSNARLNNVSLFDELTTAQQQAPLSINTFSAFIAKLSFSEISVSAKTSNSINFTIHTTLNFANGDAFSFNGKSFTISKVNGNFELGSANSNFTLFANTTTNQLFYKSGSTILNLDEITENSNIPETDLKQMSVFIGLMEMFAKGNIETSHPPVINALPGAPATYRGTAVGFYTSRASATRFCNAANARILAAHPGWWTPGVDVSCVWDNHFCVCTADYYS